MATNGHERDFPFSKKSRLYLDVTQLIAGNKYVRGKKDKKEERGYAISKLNICTQICICIYSINTRVCIYIYKYTYIKRERKSPWSWF